MYASLWSPSVRSSQFISLHYEVCTDKFPIVSFKAHRLTELARINYNSDVWTNGQSKCRISQNNHMANLIVYCNLVYTHFFFYIILVSSVHLSHLLAGMNCWILLQHDKNIQIIYHTCKIHIIHSLHYELSKNWDILPYILYKNAFSILISNSCSL